MGIVKSNRRNRLSDDLLDQLMTVSVHGQYFMDKPDEDHLIAQAIQSWHSKKIDSDLKYYAYMYFL